MGGNTSRGAGAAADSALERDADEAQTSALQLKSRDDVLAWKARLEARLAICVEEEAERIAAEEEEQEARHPSLVQAAATKS